MILYYITLNYHIVSMRRTSRFFLGERRFHVFFLFFFRKRSDRHQAVGALSAPNTGVHPESEEGQQGAILEDGILMDIRHKGCKKHGTTTMDHFVCS